jgi:hypothetical protein
MSKSYHVYRTAALVHALWNGWHLGPVAISGLPAAAGQETFDGATAVDAAICCLWSRVVNRLRCMISPSKWPPRASLYNAFGDKQSLYRRVLNYGLEQSVYDRRDRLKKNAIVFVTGDQFKPEFPVISPNGRTPAIVDTEPSDNRNWSWCLSQASSFCITLRGRVEFCGGIWGRKAAH